MAAHGVVQNCWLNSRFIGDLDIGLDRDDEPHALAPLLAHRAHLVAHMSPELLRFAARGQPAQLDREEQGIRLVFPELLKMIA